MEHVSYSISNYVVAVGHGSRAGSMWRDALTTFLEHNIQVYKALSKGVDYMFNPEEWTKLFMDIQGKARIIYINEHTGLSKLRVTFTKEQQKALDHKIVDTGGPLLQNRGE